MDFQYEPGRIYALGPSGALLAEITFPDSDGVADISHTFVDHSLRGQGVAEALVMAALTQIRAQGLGMTATCPYAVKWLAARPDQADWSGHNKA